MPKGKIANVQRQLRTVQAGSSFERRRLDLLRRALDAPERVLVQNDTEEAEKSSLRFWYLVGRNGHVTIAPDGACFWIAVHGTPPFVSWAGAALTAFCRLRRTGANSLLAEMSRLPDSNEATVLRQALALPIARAHWVKPEHRAEARA